MICNGSDIFIHLLIIIVNDDILTLQSMLVTQRRGQPLDITHRPPIIHGQPLDNTRGHLLSMASH